MVSIFLFYFFKNELFHVIIPVTSISFTGKSLVHVYVISNLNFVEFTTMIGIEEEKFC